MIGNPATYEKHNYANVSALYTGFEQHRVRIGTGLSSEDITTSEIKNFYYNNGVSDSITPRLMNVTGNPLSMSLCCRTVAM